MRNHHPHHIPTLQAERPGTVATRIKAMRESSPVEFSTQQLVLLDSIGFEIGQLLQGIPKKERKLTIARLTNVSQYCREQGLPIDVQTLIDGIVRGWELFPNDVIPVPSAKPRS